MSTPKVNSWLGWRNFTVNNPTVSFLFLFFLVFDPWKIDYLLNLACDILASLGPRNVDKDMLNTMVSPIERVVMNHQNQTRTNGIWGHVRYRTARQQAHPTDPTPSTHTCCKILRWCQVGLVWFLMVMWFADWWHKEPVREHEWWERPHSDHKIITRGENDKPHYGYDDANEYDVLWGTRVPQKCNKQ
jgi:hypothetical protein